MVNLIAQRPFVFGLRPKLEAGSESPMFPKSGAKIPFRAPKFETDAKIRDCGFELPPIWIEQQFEPTVMRFDICFKL